MPQARNGGIANKENKNKYKRRLKQNVTERESSTWYCADAAKQEQSKEGWTAFRCQERGRDGWICMQRLYMQRGSHSERKLGSVQETGLFVGRMDSRVGVGIADLTEQGEAKNDRRVTRRWAARRGSWKLVHQSERRHSSSVDGRGGARRYGGDVGWRAGARMRRKRRGKGKDMRVEEGGGRARGMPEGRDVSPSDLGFLESRQISQGNSGASDVEQNYKEDERCREERRRRELCEAGRRDRAGVDDREEAPCDTHKTLAAPLESDPDIGESVQQGEKSGKDGITH
ncbi:hypothetical protein C8R45DRAFT_935668 [Mycena sanguinolenta]|nr:hypothetical protein C8R45DRAFT_935668 [Mycena sanguinolenta]